MMQNETDGNALVTRRDKRMKKLVRDNSSCV